MSLIMNNNADFFVSERKNMNGCRSSSESDSDSESFYLVGTQSDYESDSYIMLDDESDAENVDGQDNKCDSTTVVNEESPDEDNAKDQIDTENVNNDDHSHSDESVHDKVPMAEEIGQTGVVDSIDDECTEEEQEFMEENPPENAITKNSEDAPSEFCENTVNSVTDPKEISLEEGSVGISEENSSVNEEIKQVEDNNCSETDNIQTKEAESIEHGNPKEINLVESNPVVPDEEEYCTDEGEEYSYDEEEYSYDEEEYSYDEEESNAEETATKTTDHNKDGSDKLCEDIISNETKIKESNLLENNTVDFEANKEEVVQTGLVDNINNDDEESEFAREAEVIEEKTAITTSSEDSASKNEEISLEDGHRSETDNIANKDDYSTDEGEEFSYDEEECSDEEEPATATTKHNKDGSDKVCEDIVSKEIKIEECDREVEEIGQTGLVDKINSDDEKTEFSKKQVETTITASSEDGPGKFCENIANSESKTEESSQERSNLAVPEVNNSGNTEIAHVEDDHSSKEECYDEEEYATDEESYDSEEYYDEDEYTDEEKDSDKEEAATTKHNEDGSDKFCEDIANNEIKIKEINVVENNPIISEANKSVSKESDHKVEEVSQTGLVDNINSDDKCTDEEEEVIEKKIITAITTSSEDDPDNIVNSTSITEERKPIVPEVNNSVTKEIEHVQDYHCNDTDNNASKEEYATDEEESYDSEEYYDEDEYTDEEEGSDKEEVATTTTKHNEDGSDKFCEDIASNETKIKEINVVENISVVSEASESVSKESEHKVEVVSQTGLVENINSDGKCTDEEKEVIEKKAITTSSENGPDNIVNITSKTEESIQEERKPIVPEVNNSVTKEDDHCNETDNNASKAECDGEEEYATDEEESYDSEEEYYDEDEYTYEEEDSDKEEAATATTKHNEDGSDKFCENNANNETKIIEISVVENISKVSEANKSVSNENDHKVEEDKCTDEEEVIEKKTITAITTSSEDGPDNSTSKTEERKPVVPEVNNSVTKEIEHLEENHCSETVNIASKEDCTDEEEYSTDEAESFFDEEESTNEDKEFIEEAKLKSTEKNADSVIITDESKTNEIKRKECNSVWIDGIEIAKIVVPSYATEGTCMIKKEVSQASSAGSTIKSEEICEWRRGMRYT